MLEVLRVPPNGSVSLQIEFLRRKTDRLKKTNTHVIKKMATMEVDGGGFGRSNSDGVFSFPEETAESEDAGRQLRTAVTDMCRPYCGMAPPRSAYGMAARPAAWFSWVLAP